jgi:predicted nucleic acid-binding protein
VRRRKAGITFEAGQPDSVRRANPINRAAFSLAIGGANEQIYFVCFLIDVWIGQSPRHRRSLVSSAAVLSDRGASRQILLDGLARQYIWLCSVPLMLEYESVMKRPVHLDDSGLAANDIDVLLDSAAAVIHPVRFSYLWRPMLKDSKDEMVLETAVSGQAELVVTMDVRHLESGLHRFGIRALRPGDALRMIRRNRKGDVS